MTSTSSVSAASSSAVTWQRRPLSGDDVLLTDLNERSNGRYKGNHLPASAERRLNRRLSWMNYVPSLVDGGNHQKPSGSSCFTPVCCYLRRSLGTKSSRTPPLALLCWVSWDWWIDVRQPGKVMVWSRMWKKKHQVHLNMYLWRKRFKVLFMICY